MTQRYAPDPVLSEFKLPNSLLKIQKGSQNDRDSTPQQRDVKQIVRECVPESLFISPSSLMLNGTKTHVSYPYRLNKTSTMAFAYKNVRSRPPSFR